VDLLGAKYLLTITHGNRITFFDIKFLNIYGTLGIRINELIKYLKFAVPYKTVAEVRVFF